MKKAFMLVKYAFCLIAACMAARTLKRVEYLWVCGMELVFAAVVTEILLQKNKLIGTIVHYALMLVYTVQIGLLYFSGSFLSVIMLENIGLLEDLSGKMAVYLSFALAAMVCTFLPPTAIARQKWRTRSIVCVLLALLAVETFNIGVIGKQYAIGYSLVNLAEEISIHRSLKSNVGAAANADLFFRQTVEDCIPKPEVLADTPNVILIFTEGLSSNVVTDARNIMPNVRAFLKNAISFENYYNHTAATFMGLSGQLYSGYQLNNTDSSCLIGLQHIFKDNGYHTAFINPEPYNEEFTNFLIDFGFDAVIGEARHCTTNSASGGIQFIDDSDMYDLLFDTCMEQSEKGAPFFTAIYTFGTHVSMDSPDPFGDGSDPVLNRFHHLDRSFGAFLEKFMDSSLAENTVLIFTEDHATYPDNDFRRTFPEEERIGYTSEVPLGIYYKGVVPAVFDVNGRNSLGLAPTILDLLDISAPNYFLGSSLFSGGQHGELETIFQSLSEIFNTADGIVRKPDKEESSHYLRVLSEYFTLKSAGESRALISISDELQPDGVTLKISLSNVPPEYNYITLPMWSVIGQQDDIRWIPAQKDAEGNWSATVNMLDFDDIGEFIVHIYAGVDQNNPSQMEKLGGRTLTYTDILGLNLQLQEDRIHTKIRVCNVPSAFDDICLSMWSTQNGQKDIQWLTPEKAEDGSWEAVADMTDFEDIGEYTIQIYAGKDGTEAGRILLGGRTFTMKKAVGLQTQLQEDGIHMKISLRKVSGAYNCVYFPMWSSANGQDDIIWLKAQQTEEGRWEAVVNMEDFADTGEYVMHLYCGKNGDMTDLVLKGVETIQYSLAVHADHGAQADDVLEPAA